MESPRKHLTKIIGFTFCKESATQESHTHANKYSWISRTLQISSIWECWSIFIFFIRCHLFCYLKRALFSWKYHPEFSRLFFCGQRFWLEGNNRNQVLHEMFFRERVTGTFYTNYLYWSRTLIFQKICVICLIESHLKMMKNAFYFILKALFVFKMFKFLSRLFVHLGKTAWLER